MYILVTILLMFLILAIERICSNIDISSLVIISIILMIFRFDQAVILLGEIRCWSLLGLS